MTAAEQPAGALGDAVAAAVEVLAAHELVGKSVAAKDDHACRLITRPHDGCGCQRIVVGCTGCDWVTEADGTQGDAHRAHVAQAVAARLAAVPAAVDERAGGEAVTEWRVRYAATGRCYRSTEAENWGPQYVKEWRTTTTYVDVVTDWTPATQPTQERPGD